MGKEGLGIRECDTVSEVRTYVFHLPSKFHVETGTIWVGRIYL